MSTIKYFRS